jgi:copper chaperone CopZ
MKQLTNRIALAIACISLGFAFSDGAAFGKPAAGANQQQDLHRMDFRVEGASCVACLRRTGQELRDTKGVIKADVSIYRPYWAIVIYDAKQTNLEKMKDAVKLEKIRLVGVEDQKISAVPAIVIPKGVGMTSNTSQHPDN